MYIYIYIYIFSLKKKTKDRLLYDYKFISILFCVSDVNQKHKEKYNRTSSDLMDKINQNRQENLNVQLLNDFLVLEEVLSGLTGPNNTIYIYIYGLQCLLTVLVPHVV